MGYGICAVEIPHEDSTEIARSSCRECRSPQPRIEIARMSNGVRLLLYGGRAENVRWPFDRRVVLGIRGFN